MAASQNGNGVVKIRLRTLGIILGIVVSLLAIGGTAITYVDAEAKSESRLVAVEEKVEQHKTALREVKGVVAELQLSVKELNTHLEWIRSEIKQGKRRQP